MSADELFERLCDPDLLPQDRSHQYRREEANRGSWLSVNHRLQIRRP